MVSGVWRSDSSCMRLRKSRPSSSSPSVEKSDTLKRGAESDASCRAVLAQAPPGMMEMALMVRSLPHSGSPTTPSACMSMNTSPSMAMVGFSPLPCIWIEVNVTAFFF